VNRAYEEVSGFQHPAWRLKGHIVLVDKDGREVRAENILRNINIRTDPDQFKVQSYRVQLSIPEIGGDLPAVIFEVENWGKKEIDLRSASEVTIDRSRKIIEIKNPITIKDQFGGSLRLDLPLAR